MALGYWINGVKSTTGFMIAAQKDALNLSYWKGDTRIVSVAVPEEVTAIEGDFHHWPNVTEVIVMNRSAVVTGLDTKFANTSGITYWVADDMLTAYETAYPTLSFNTWPNYATWTIPYIAGETSTTLTAAYVAQEIAKNPLTQYATKVVVPSYFTDYSAGALDAIFDGIANLETIESPWLNGTKTGGMEWTIPTSGSTTLAASYVQSKIDDCVGEYATKVVVPAYFVNFEQGYIAPLANVATIERLEVTFSGNSTNKTLPAQFGQSNYLGIKEYVDNDQVIHGYYNYSILGNLATLESMKFPNATSRAEGLWTGSGNKMVNVLELPLLATAGGILIADSSALSTWKKVIAPSLTNAKTRAVFNSTSGPFKLVLGNTFCEVSSDFILGAPSRTDLFIYVPTSLLTLYLTSSMWSNFYGYLVGYLDYTDTVPTFSGYTDQWYADEECTTVIATSAFVSGTRYFVKLTAI